MLGDARDFCYSGRAGAVSVMALAWNPDKALALRKEGLSWEKIGAVFGISLSTVRCRLDPEYAERRRQQINARRAENRGSTGIGRVPRPRKKRNQSMIFLMKAMECRPLPEPKRSPDEHHLAGMTLMMLTEHRCRWPVNDAAKGETHLFCGAPKDVTKPYCEYHCGRACGTGTLAEQRAHRELERRAA